MLKFVTLSLTKKTTTKLFTSWSSFWKCQLYISFGFTCVLCILLFHFRSMKWFLGRKRKLKREDQLQKELKEVALQSNWSKQLVRIWHEYSHLFFFNGLKKILLSVQSNLCCYIILKFGTSTSLKLAEGPQSDRFFCKAGHSFLIVLLCMLLQKQLMGEIKYFLHKNGSFSRQENSP